MILTSVDAPAVQQLLGSPDISLISLTRANAYTAIYPFLFKLILPAGAADLADNRPPADVEMVATKTSLVVRRDLPPAVQFLLHDAATEIHSPPELFHRPAEFPAAEAIDLPLSESARRFYKSGMPFLQHHLPLWLAVLTEQLAILLVPLAAIVYPMLRALPAAYDWGVQRRIHRPTESSSCLSLGSKRTTASNNQKRCSPSFPSWRAALPDCGFRGPSLTWSIPCGAT
jgi:hypothetical protein